MVIEVSVTLVGFILLAIIGIGMGAKKGFASGISDFIAFAVVLLILRIVLAIYYGYTKGNTMDVVIAVVVLLVLGLVYGVVKIILKSIRAISDLPVIGVLDKLLGIVLGLVIVVLIFYAVVTASRYGYFGKVGKTILTDVNNDKWLSYIASYDLVNKLIEWKNNLVG